ncbi:unnamed protein product [marine sediment metagenome]|uniref:Uncharacterized protein n=1 Tax=marine sediment metagenome TaxID=412755 RepID=X0X6I9_9ZZZZ
MERTGHRKIMIRELVETLERGPASLDKEQKERYDLWCRTWILPKIRKLIPELRKKDKLNKEGEK